MDNYFLPMNEHYKQKCFPKGFMEAQRKNNSIGGIVLIIVSIVLSIAFVPVMIFGIGIIISSIKDGDSDGVTAGIFIGGIGLLFTCACIFFFILGIRMRKDTVEDCLSEMVKFCKYPENTILDFVSQVTQSDTLILHLAGSWKAKSGLGIGILTRDFILIGPMIMKKSDIKTVCLVNSKNYRYVNYKRITSYSLNMAFISNKGTHVMTDTKKDAAEKLMAILLEENPNIDTKQGEILIDEMYEACYKAQELNS